MTAQGISRALDRIPRTELRVAGRGVPAFRACGTAGFALGIAAGAGLAAAHGRSVWLVLVLGGVGALTFMLLSALSRAPDGSERLVYYHHQLALLLTTTTALLLAGAPVLAYSDSVAVGLGVFLVLGRVGCLMVGCCHGRPGRFGISYGAGHVHDGFPAHRVGVRLVPVQAFESLWTLVAVGLAVAASWRGPGAGAATYLVAYAAGRFLLEGLRGDGARPYLLGVSEGQWTSVALAVAVVAAEAAGALPPVPLHIVAAAALAAGALVVAGVAARRRGSDRHLLTPRHLDEVAWTAAHLADRAAVDGRLAPAPGPIPSAVHVAATSEGLSISASTRYDADGAVHHFALSRPGALQPATAAALGHVLCTLTGEAPPPALLTRGGDVFHLTVTHGPERLPPGTAGP